MVTEMYPLFDNFESSLQAGDYLTEQAWQVRSALDSISAPAEIAHYYPPTWIVRVGLQRMAQAFQCLDDETISLYQPTVDYLYAYLHFLLEISSHHHSYIVQDVPRASQIIDDANQPEGRLEMMRSLVDAYTVSRHLVSPYLQKLENPRENLNLIMKNFYHSDLSNR